MLPNGGLGGIGAFGRSGGIGGIGGNLMGPSQFNPENNFNNPNLSGIKFDPIDPFGFNHPNNDHFKRPGGNSFGKDHFF